MWKKEKRITETKYTRNISFPEARKIEKQTREQPSYAYATKKKGNEEKGDTKPKQEELNKLINELKNWIEILKTITKETIKEHISTVPDKCERHNQNQEKSPQQRKEKIQTKQKTLINEPIPLSNRFSPMDIEDPVETTIEDSDEITTHIKTDTIKLQKRLNKKINTKDNPTENETTNSTKKNETQTTKSTSRSKVKEKKNQKPTPPSPP